MNRCAPLTPLLLPPGYRDRYDDRYRDGPRRDMDRGFGGRDRYDDRSRDYDRGRMFPKDCWARARLLPRRTSCPAWPGSPPVAGEGVPKTSRRSSSPGNFNPWPCSGPCQSPGLARILRPLGRRRPAGRLLLCPAGLGGIGLTGKGFLSSCRLRFQDRQRQEGLRQRVSPG